MDSNQFASSYMSVVLYLSEKDPMLAEYLLARFPHFLEMDQNTFDRVKRNTNKWLKKTEISYTKPKQQKMASKILPYGIFVDSVYNLAKVYTYGSESIPRNVYRANKFIRILKLLEDERYQTLQKENNQRKIKKMKKSSQQ